MNSSPANNHLLQQVPPTINLHDFNINDESPTFWVGPIADEQNGMIRLLRAQALLVNA
jgi:hypothetical protein